MWQRSSRGISLALLMQGVEPTCLYADNRDVNRENDNKFVLLESEQVVLCINAGVFQSEWAWLCYV
jgi:hypothetical protein